MKKYEVGHEWEIHEDYEEINRVGGYCVAMKGSKVYIIGKRIFNISDSTIKCAGIIPFLGNSLTKVDSDLDQTFNYKPEKLYYGVMYGEEGRVYVFDNATDAFQLVNILVDFKAYGLTL